MERFAIAKIGAEPFKLLSLKKLMKSVHLTPLSTIALKKEYVRVVSQIMSRLKVFVK